MKKYTLIIISLLAVFLLFYLNVFSEKEYKNSFFYMDTFITVKIYEKNEKVFTEIENLFKKYHNLTNRYESVQNLKNIYYLNNILKNEEAIKIDEDLYSLLEYSKLIYRETEANINIALGNAIDVWKEYRDYEKIGIPTEDELNLINSISIEDIVLSNNQYMKKKDVSIDLGALVKGYVTEEASLILENHGIDNYIINAGGNVKVGNSNKGFYKIGISDPLEANTIFTTLKIENKSIVTSGGYERYYEYEGEKYHHILDSKTLFPPQNNLASVTVITDNSSYADVMSTYLFLLGYEKGLRLLENKNDIEVIWYFKDASIKKTPGVSKYE